MADAPRVRFAAATVAPIEPAGGAEEHIFNIIVNDMRTHEVYNLRIEYYVEPARRLLEMKTSQILALLDAQLTPPRGDAFIGIPRFGPEHMTPPFEFDDLSSPGAKRYVNLRKLATQGLFIFNRADAAVNALGGIAAARRDAQPVLHSIFLPRRYPMSSRF